MFSKKLRAFACEPLMLSASTLFAVQTERVNGLPVIILKSDDLKGDWTNAYPEQKAAWLNYLSYVESVGGKATVGAIGEHFEGDTTDDLSFYQDVQTYFVNEGHQIFNHGNTAITSTYNGTLSEQEADFNQAQNNIISRLSLPQNPTALGTPGNQENDYTVTLINEHPDLRQWLYGKSSAALDDDILSYGRFAIWGNLDSPQSVTLPDGEIAEFDKVNHPFDIEKNDADLSVCKMSNTEIAGSDLRYELRNRFAYAVNQGEDYVMMQMHPGRWGSDMLECFQILFDELLATYPDVAIWTADEYYQYLTQSEEPGNTTSNAFIEYQNDFENGALPVKSGTGILEISTDHAFDGMSALKSVVTKGGETYRAEAKDIFLEGSGNKYIEPNKEYWVGFSVFVPEGNSSSNHIDMFFQMHQAPDAGEKYKKPPITGVIVNDQWQFSVRSEFDGVMERHPVDVVKNQWTSFVLRILPSATNGEVEAWINGESVMVYSGQTMWNNITGMPFIKYGLYRRVFSETYYTTPGNPDDGFPVGTTRTLYHDAVKIASNA